MREEWRDIKGYEGRYQVSNFGRVRSLDRKTVKSDGVIQHSKGKLLSLYKSTTGYLQTRIEGGKHIIVHRAVAEAFLSHKDSDNVVNHKNGVRTDNRSENLEWTTFSGNTLHGVHVTKNIRDQLLHPMKKVLCVETGEEFDSIATAARQKGLWGQNIWHVCQGHWNKCGGYHWRYVDGS